MQQKNMGTTDTRTPADKFFNTIATNRILASALVTAAVGGLLFFLLGGDNSADKVICGMDDGCLDTR